ncbi:hypothetical protein GCM10027445_39200 [Amycolatopsis endophytica]|uniref:Uncharacterized protein n=1 Tax=Amycolatopsis endophytica TaxID=860233 RepID=A0A853B0C2_9PSEU|nr:hypothetical protein [Amycolatopsis endophytica]NYI88284.1 hypothetical protein [Amycolatopsis endophytica]
MDELVLVTGAGKLVVDAASAAGVRQQLIALVATAISAATGVAVPCEQLGIEELRRIDPRFAEGCEYLNNNPEPPVDIAALRELHPHLTTFPQWLQHGGSEQLKAVFGATKNNVSRTSG